MEKVIANLLKRISLKKVKTFQGHEGVGLNAEVYFDKVNVAFALDDANGGEMDFEVSNKEKFKELLEIIDTLPEIDLYPGFGSKPLIGKPDLAWMIDHILSEKEKEKGQKKIEKEFLTKICFGIPNGSSYSSFDLKKQLTIYPTNELQSFIDKRVKPILKEGEVILNTNLEKMGIKI